MLDVALSCIARGWHVFPCLPRSKKPMTAHGWHDASVDDAQVRAWWGKSPAANVAIACNPSNLCVVDVDHGLESAEALTQWLKDSHLEPSYAVRTGRRPEFGVQIYFQGAIPDVGLFQLAGCEGQIKSLGGYVMAAGSIHPDSGEAYRELWDTSFEGLSWTPDSIRGLCPVKNQTPDGLITENRNVALASVAGKLRNAGLSSTALEVALLQVNADRCAPPMSDREVRKIAANIAKYPIPETREITLGRKGDGTVAKSAHGGQEAAIPAQEWAGDWRELFHTREETENTREPMFLIDKFLQEESVTGLIGPARARKSIITVNIIHALLTGEPLFGQFTVANKPERVIYLCPETGLMALSRRIRAMGLTKFVGESFFYTSMNSDPLSFTDARLREAFAGAVILIDTAIRFFEGDENSAQDMKVLGGQCHELIRAGARAVVLLHHTAKNAEGVTLENGRGSGDFGGFLTCCWGTTLDDYESAFSSESLMTCVKQRDFRADSFKVSPSGDEDNFFLQYIDGSENSRVQIGTKVKAGKARAVAFIRSHTTKTAEWVCAALKEQGVEYSVSACQAMLREARKTPD